jgi:hypothetical protein
MVVGFAVAVTACHTVSSVSLRTFAATAAAIAHRGSDVVAVTVIVGVVLVMMVVVVVDGVVTVVVVMVMMVEGVVIRPAVIRIIPAPTVVETVVIPTG